MNWEQRRLLEMAGILRRGTPIKLLLEGDDEEEDDIFADDAGDDEGGDEGGGDEEAPAEEKEPPEELSPEEMDKYGSTRFFEIENRVTQMFNNAKVSASAASQGQEGYPGVAEPEEAESTPAKDEEEANESFYRYGNRRDKWLIKEATRLLNEAEDGISAESFDMERFCNEFAQYMESVDFVSDIQNGLFNFARQMILNNFQDPATEQKFITMLKGKLTKDYDFIPSGSEAPEEIPVAAGASAGGGGGV